MYVLLHIRPSGLERRPQALQGDQLHRWVVAAIIDDDVILPGLVGIGNNLGQQAQVGLVAHVERAACLSLNALLILLRALHIRLYEGYRRSREEPAPQLQPSSNTHTRLVGALSALQARTKLAVQEHQYCMPHRNTSPS